MDATSIKGPSIKYVRHAIFGQLLPPPLSHFVTHPGTPPESMSHISDPPTFRRPSTKNPDKSLLVQILSQLFAGVFVRGFCQRVFCLEGFVWGGFVPSRSVRIHLLQQKVKHHF